MKTHENTLLANTSTLVWWIHENTWKHIISIILQHLYGGFMKTHENTLLALYGGFMKTHENTLVA